MSDLTIAPFLRLSCEWCCDMGTALFSRYAALWRVLGYASMSV